MSEVYDSGSSTNPFLLRRSMKCSWKCFHNTIEPKGALPLLILVYQLHQGVRLFIVYDLLMEGFVSSRTNACYVTLEFCYPCNFGN